jgi:hypothetical protein
MTPSEILATAMEHGVTISLSGNDQLKINGKKISVERLESSIRQHREGLIALLTWRKIAPGCCRECERLEIVKIMGHNVPGCLYRSQGQFAEGWRRLPADAMKCIWENRR